MFVELKKSVLKRKSYLIRKGIRFRKNSNSKKVDLYKEKSSKNFIQDQDFLIIAENCCLKSELDRKRKNLYFVTEDMNLCRYVPDNILEIIIPQVLYN